MQEVSYQKIHSEENGQRLDNYLIRKLKGVPKSHIYRIIRSGEVRINKKRAKVHSRVCTGDLIRIPPIRTAEQKEPFVSSKTEALLQKSIIHEDQQFLILNKPAGIAVHGGSGLSLGIIEALRKTRKDLHYLELAHRLDKETSGCLVLAKKRSALRAFQNLLETREVIKIYWSIDCHPWKGNKRVVINQPIEKNILSSGERIVKLSPKGKASETRFTLLENYEHACLVEAIPKTGRTHQIRIHSAEMNHVIIGDTKYGYDENKIPKLKTIPKRLYLHAREIKFNLNGTHHHYRAEIDGPFKTTLSLLRKGV